MPSAEQLKQFLLGVVMPPLVGIAVTWVVANVHVLNLFNISEAQLGGELTLLATWAVSTAFTWLTQHHILAAHYTLQAKAAVGNK